MLLTAIDFFISMTAPFRPPLKLMTISRCLPCPNCFINKLVDGSDDYVNYVDVCSGCITEYEYGAKYRGPHDRQFREYFDAASSQFMVDEVKAEWPGIDFDHVTKGDRVVGVIEDEKKQLHKCTNCYAYHYPCGNCTLEDDYVVMSYEEYKAKSKRGYELPKSYDDYCQLKND